MFRPRHAARLSALVLCVLAAAPAAHAGDPAALAPLGTWAYVGWSPSGEPCPLLKLAEATLHAPFVQNALGDKAAVFERGFEVVRQALQHDGALVLLASEAGPQRVAEQFGLVVAADDAAAALTEAFTAWARAMCDPWPEPEQLAVEGATLSALQWQDGQKVLWGTHGAHFVAAVGEDTARRLVMRLTGTAPALTDHPEFRAARDRVQPAESGGSVSAYANVHTLLELLPELDTGAEDPDEFGRIVAALGLNALKSLYVHFDQSAQGFRMSGYCHMEGTAGVARLYKQKPLTDDDLRAVPQDAFWATVWNLDLADLWQEALRVLEEIKPDAVPPVEAALAIASEFVGLSIVDDLLPAFGDTWTLYDSPSHGGVLITGTVLTAEVRNPDALQHLLSEVVNRLTPLAAASKIRLEQKELKHGPHTVHYVLVGGYPVPVAPAWGFAGGRWVFGLFPQTVAVALRQADPATRGPSLLDQPDFRAARGQLPDPLTCVGYADARYSYRLWYALKHLAQTAVASLSAGTPHAFDLATVPTLPEELPTVRNAVWGYGADEHGVLYRGVGDSGASLLLSSDPSGLASTALVVSVLLPSLARAREISKRAVSASNLHGIGQACHIYAHNTDGRFPAGLEPLLDEEFITKQMLHSPRDELPGDSYIYLTGQTRRDPADNVLAYERVTGDEGTSVLFVDGHVEWMKPDAFRRAVRQTYQRLDREKELPAEFRAETDKEDAARPAE